MRQVHLQVEPFFVAEGLFDDFLQQKLEVSLQVFPVDSLPPLDLLFQREKIPPLGMLQSPVYLLQVLHVLLLPHQPRLQIELLSNQLLVVFLVVPEVLRLVCPLFVQEGLLGENPVIVVGDDVLQFRMQIHSQIIHIQIQI